MCTDPLRPSQLSQICWLLCNCQSAVSSSWAVGAGGCAAVWAADRTSIHAGGVGLFPFGTSAGTGSATLLGRHAILRLVGGGRRRRRCLASTHGRAPRCGLPKGPPGSSPCVRGEAHNAIYLLVHVRDSKVVWIPLFLVWIPLLILLAAHFDSSLKPIPGNVPHWSPAPAKV